MVRIDQLLATPFRGDWIRRNAYFLIWASLFLAQFVRLAAVGYVNRVPIDLLSAFTATAFRTSFWLVAFSLLARRLPPPKRDWLSNLRQYLPAVSLMGVASLLWALASDTLFLPNAPTFFDHLPNRLLYDTGPHLALSALFMGALVWRTHPAGKQQRLVPPDRALKVRQGDTSLLLSTRDVRAIVAQDYYAEIRSERGTYLIRQSIKSLQQELADSGFVRINRSTIVNCNYVDTIKRKSGEAPLVVMKDGASFKVSKNYVSDLKLGSS